MSLACEAPAVADDGWLAVCELVDAPASAVKAAFSGGLSPMAPHGAVKTAVEIAASQNAQNRIA
jgi:hypothetical protein